jgi:Protein of unknown function (DUF4058)
MPSPFPGMNPFLEQNDTWEDFHNDFMARMREALAREIRPNYIAKVETRIYIRELLAEERALFGKADVSVSRSPRTSRKGVSVAESTVAAPQQLSFPNVDEERQCWIEIIDVRTRKVVTVIEVLSPTNKRSGPDRDDYLNKRATLTLGLVNFVEIDLRRCGTRPQPPGLPHCDYYVLVARKQEWPRFDFWPLGLRDRLPVIGVPLLPPDADVLLDLQAVLNRTYDAAGYGDYVYSETPEPPLSPEDAAWAKSLIPQPSAAQ